jgi:hypothetical protein
MLELINNNLMLMLTIIGTLAFIVSVITEVTKQLPLISKVPTDFQVIILSVVLCVGAYLAYSSYAGLVIVWYYIAAVLVAAFMVAFVAMYGWDKFTQLWNRFKISSFEIKGSDQQ